MAGATLEPSTIILANIYLIMSLQLGLNWNHTDCNTNSYLFQLGFIIIYVIRLFFQEWYNNQIIRRSIWIFLSVLSLILLVSLGGYQAYTVFENPDDFYYNADTNEGNQICFQNRIVFLGEVLIMFLTPFKDFYFICCAKDET